MVLLSNDEFKLMSFINVKTKISQQSEVVVTRKNKNFLLFLLPTQFPIHKQ